MVNRFGCDICSTDVEYDDNTALISKGEKLKDLCPNCAPRVIEFIEDQKENLVTIKITPELPQVQFEKARDLLKEQGYIVYKPKPRKRKIGS